MNDLFDPSYFNLVKQLIKLLNITPHAFLDDCIETEYVDLAIFKDRCLIRLLPLSKEEQRIIEKEKTPDLVL